MPTNVTFDVYLPDAFRVGRTRLRMLTGSRKIARKIKKDFDATTITWKKRAKFKIEVKMSASEASVGVTTEDEKYGWLDKGVPGRRIFPTGGRRQLVFPGVFKAKTVPREIASYTGVRSGRVKAKYVDWPGIEAREFEETIYAKWVNQFYFDWENLMREVAEETGWAY